MKDFKNWRYIFSKGCQRYCYRYVISNSVAYEIFIKYWDPDTPIKTAKASLCRTKTSYCLVPDWYLNNEVTMTEREWLGKELPVQELLEIAYKDDKENNK